MRVTFKSLVHRKRYEAVPSEGRGHRFDPRKPKADDWPTTGRHVLLGAPVFPCECR